MIPAARGRQAVVTLVAILFFNAQVALAAPPLAVIDVDGNQSADSTDIHYFVQKGIRTSDTEVEEVALDDVLDAGARQNAIQNVTLGQRALKEGLALFEKGEYAAAVDRFDQAVLLFEQSFVFLEDPEDYISALIHGGVALARLGSRQPALQLLTRALVVEPEYDFSGFPGEKKLFEDAVKALRAKDLSSISVRTDPDASRVFVDGGYRGVAPVYRPALRQGGHFVRVERQGYGREGQQVSTTAIGGKSPNVEIEIKQRPVRKKGLLDGLLAGLQAEMGQPEASKDSAIARLGGALLVDYLVLYRATGPSESKTVQLALYDVRSGRLLNQVEGTTDWSARDRAAKNAVMDLARDLLDVDLKQVVRVDISGTPETNGGDEGGIATKWWFWTIIGVVAAGTTVGLVLGLQPQDEGPAGLSEDGNGAVILRF